MSGGDPRDAREVRSAVRRVQVALVSIVGGHAVLFGVAAGVLVGTFGGVVVGWLIGIVVAGAVAWRSHGVGSLERAALWVEERDPRLQYALVTAVDPRYRGWSAPTYRGALLRRAAVRALGPAMLAVGVACGVRWVATARGYHVPVLSERGARGAEAPQAARAAANRLVPLVAHVAPPEYSHLQAREVAEPATIASLVGSAIVLRGRGDTTGILAQIGTRAVRVERDRGGWRLAFTMPDKAALVRLRDGAHDRLVVLAPIPDAPPTVQLTAPVRDSVMREAHGVLPLEARASDDIGLESGEFEVIVTSGTEDEGGVHGKTLTVGHVAFGDVRTAPMAGGFLLDSLHPGELVSIRAVVRDANTVSGPGVGTSETRTYRLATKEEYDSIAVEGAPPPGLDSSYMSQRMIVMKTQVLLKRMGGRRPVVRDTVVAVTGKLGSQEDKLKSKVSQILYGGDQRMGEAMSPVERVLFDTALASMTDASMSLAIAEAKEALPRELVALAVLDTIRMLQHRLYLRGQPPVLVVNVARVRLKGTSTPEAAGRPTEVADDSVRLRLVQEFGAIVRSQHPWSERPGVADSLTVLQVDAIGVDPAVASALGDAVSALRARQDPAPSLARVRLQLGGRARADTAAGEWAGGGGL
jgi:hypothetical protein